jgi:hypothetical protein
MFLKRMFAPVRNSFFPTRQEHDDALKARIILSRVRELMELSSAVPPGGPREPSADAKVDDSALREQRI